MLKKINLFLLLISVIITIGCSETKQVDELQTEHTIVNGVILDYPDSCSYISILIDDIISGEQTRYLSEVDSNGNFDFKVDIYIAQDVFLQYGNQLRYLLLKPNSSLYLEFNYSDYDATIKFSGKLASINHQVDEFIKLVRPIYDDFSTLDSKISTGSLEDFKLAVYKQNTINDSILNHFITDYQPDKEIEQWASNYLQYMCAGLLTNVIYHPKIKITNEYWDFKINFPLNRNDDFLCSNFKEYVVEYYYGYYYRGKLSHAFDTLKSGHIHSFIQIVSDSISSNFNGISYDIIMSSVLKTALTHDVDKVESFMLKNPNLLNNEAISEKINMEIESLKLAKSKEMDYANFINNDSLNINENWLDSLINTKYRNKIVYIDIWGTWCGICLDDMIYSKEIKQTFDNKDIVFLYICCFSDENSWKKMIDKYKIKGDHILANDEMTTLLKSKYQITGYPTYMIFNKGKKLSIDCPRPSNENFEQIINNLISRKAF